MTMNPFTDPGGRTEVAPSWQADWLMAHNTVTQRIKTITRVAPQAGQLTLQQCMQRAVELGLRANA